MKLRVFTRITTLLAVVASCFALASPADAALFVVTRSDDPDPGACDSDCSLREAVQAANDAGGGQIVFDPAVANEIDLARGELVVSGRVVLEGASRVIDQQHPNPARLFHVIADAKLDLRRVSLTGGSVGVIDGDPEQSDLGPADSGGGVLNEGELIVSSSRITGNEANGRGGGIANAAGATLTVSGSLLDWNSSGYSGLFYGEGGGLYNAGAASITGTTFALNTAIAGFMSDPSPLGGAIYNDGTTTIRWSTFAGNYSSFLGEAFMNSGTISVSASIVNQVAPCAGSAVTSGGYNVFATACEGIVDGSSGDVIADPAITSLEDNGGFTPTFAITEASPAHDRVPVGHIACGGTDQRGVPKPQGTGCDSGAYEFATCGAGPGIVVVNIVGTSGRDVIFGTDDAEGILGLGGQDRIVARGGDDAVCGGGGGDALYGGDGNDYLGGESGTDRCFGEAGADAFKGCETRRN